jgi:hypothetical protein
MRKSQHFKGKILFSKGTCLDKKTLMTYHTEPMKAGFEENVMAAFDFLNFSTEEKKNLSLRHRNLLNNYRQLNLFSLNADSQKLIEEISSCKSEYLTIEASDYGAYICLAALYSGKLPTDKKIEFLLEKSPLALFPTTFLKASPKGQDKKIIFKISEKCWIKPFSTLYNNEKIKCSLRRAA